MHISRSCGWINIIAGGGGGTFAHLCSRPLATSSPSLSSFTIWSVFNLRGNGKTHDQFITFCAQRLKENNLILSYGRTGSSINSGLILLHFDLRLNWC